MKTKHFNLVIVGGGTTGAAAAYVAAHYTNIGRIAILESGSGFGAVNSAPRNNSQTLHDGSIETNYTKEKAEKVSAATGLLEVYLNDKAAKDVYAIGQKMAIAVGEEECIQLRNRFESIRELYPDLRFLNRSQIREWEPKVIEGRNEEEIVATGSKEGYMIDFKKLSESFVEHAVLTGKVSVYKNTTVVKVVENADGSHLVTDQLGNKYTGDVVIFATGPHSLLFAKQLGYAEHLGLLPVAGNFFAAYKKNLLRGKVYTVQNPKLPFAAVHGDPEIFDPETTRFGPTAKVLPMLTRGDYGTILDFLRVSVPNTRGVATLLKILADPTMSGYMLENLAYDLPMLGKYLFLQTARKVIPTLQYSDLKKTGFGGIRPQIVNTKTMSLEMGDAQVLGRNIIFNVTPSPGASVCLANAYRDIKKALEFVPALRFSDGRWDETYKHQPVAEFA